MAAERFYKTAAAEIVDFSCYKVVCKTIASIKVSCVRLVVGIYGNEYTLALKITLNDALFVCENRYFKVAVAQSLAFLVSLCKTLYVFGKLVAFGSLEFRSESRVALTFFCFDAPFAAVVDAGDTRHTEKHSINKRKMSRI